MKELVYVASQYSHPERFVQQIRHLATVRAVHRLINLYPDLGFFSPILHCHDLATICGLPGSWEYWKEYNRTMLSRCEHLWVLAFPGYFNSVGVQAECAAWLDIHEGRREPRIIVEELEGIHWL